jgi:hypothetical protein
MGSESASFGDAADDDVWTVDWTAWVCRVLGWDGLLPALVALAPVLVGALIPGRRGAIEITAVVLPTSAFLFRVRAGHRHIMTNRCSAAARTFQLCVFGLGVLPLVLVDAFVVLAHVMPRGALLASEGDRLVLAGFLTVYLTMMTIAMYPGRVKRPVLLSDSLPETPCRPPANAGDPWHSQPPRPSPAQGPSGNA